MDNLNPDNSNKQSALTLDHLQEMDWKRFEILCRDYFQAKGYYSRLTEVGADGGVDVILNRTQGDGTQLTTYVQCKAWSSQNVGVSYVRELYGVMAGDDVPLGIFITTSDFTNDAKAFASGKRLQLISGVRLLQLIEKLSVENQHQLKTVALSGDYKTPTCPSCDIKMILRTTSKSRDKGEQFWGCSNFPKCSVKLHRKKSESSAKYRKQKIYDALSSRESTIDDLESAYRDSSIRAKRGRRTPKTKRKASVSLPARIAIGAVFIAALLIIIPNVISWVFSEMGKSLITHSQTNLKQQQQKRVTSTRNDATLRAGQNQRALTPEQQIKIAEALGACRT